MNNGRRLQCFGKVAHPSRRLAVEAVHRLTATLDGLGKDRPALEVYRCPWCNFFHCGNTEHNRERKRMGCRRPREKLVLVYEPEDTNEPEPRRDEAEAG